MMSDRNPYEKLGVPEGATFEEIQSARSKLLEEFAGDEKQRLEVEAAYDAVLMERLKMRQEGKIPVPDRIRFPEKLAQAAPSAMPTLPKNSPAWLTNLVDTPSKVDIALPGGVQSLLGGLVVLSPTDAVLQLAMAVSVGSTLYFLYRKERKLGKAVLLGLGGLLLGFAIGAALESILKVYLPIQLGAEVFVSLVTFVILWLFSSFLK